MSLVACSALGDPPGGLRAVRPLADQALRPADGVRAGREELADDPLGEGLREPRYEIGWLLDRSPVMLPIPGTSTVAHLEENMRAVTD